MTSTSPEPYPGSAACAADLLAFANAYRRAAMSLLASRPIALSRAPATLCAIHAIELYLNAYLLHRGWSATKIRAHLHDLAVRSTLVVEQGIGLRRRTAEHLAKMTRDREYLVSRYAPDRVSTLSEINRLVATMDEIAAKVSRHIERQPGAPGLRLCPRTFPTERPASLPQP